MRRRTVLTGVAAAIVLSGLGACRQAETPEARLRALIARSEQLAEEKNAGGLRAMVSERYGDEHGQDKRAIEALLRFYFLRHRTIHLLTRIESVSLPQPGRAQAVVYAAMAGTPLPDASELSRFAADLHRFELEFTEEGGDWRLVRAGWRRAELADFLAPP
jgi:hypothetical protein